MARMKDCPECKANDIRPEDWSPDDGPYPTFTPRQARREHSWCGMRLMSGGDWNKVILTRRWSNRGVWLRKGGKPFLAGGRPTAH